MKLLNLIFTIESGIIHYSKFRKYRFHRNNHWFSSEWYLDTNSCVIVVFPINLTIFDSICAVETGQPHLDRNPRQIFSRTQKSCHASKSSCPIWKEKLKFLLTEEWVRLWMHSIHKMFIYLTYLSFDTCSTLLYTVINQENFNLPY